MKFTATLSAALALFSLRAGAETYNKVFELDAGGAAIDSVFLNPVGECFGLATDDAGKLTAFDLCHQKVLWSMNVTGVATARAIAWTADAGEFAVTSRGKITIVETVSGRIVKEIAGATDAIYVAADFSRDAHFIALKDFKNQTIVIFDVVSGELARTIDVPATSTGTIVRFSPEDKIQFTPDGRALLSAGWRGLIVFDIETGARLREYVSTTEMFSVTMAGDSTFAAFAAAGPGVTGEAHVVDLNTMKEVRTFGGLGNVYGGTMRFAADASKLYWMSMKGNMSIWDVVQGKELLTTDNPEFEDPAGSMIIWESRPLFRFAFDMATSLDFFMTAHPGRKAVEIWKMPNP